MSELVYYQIHGYRNGHQLLESSISLDRQDQDLIDRLSDMAGSLRPSEIFDPYLTAYPLPSQKYYALAKTVQDLNAPRAGCVITTTLVIASELWSKNTTPAVMIDKLNFPTRNNDEFQFSSKNVKLPIVKTSVTLELVEAIFLEKRKPTVVFDASDEILISTRLLTALWPSIRKTFSLCTFAMSPRTISGKSFDLLFSPKSARMRFSDWEGRRIEGNEKEYITRHRWARTLADMIFSSDAPNLTEIDRLGTLSSDSNGDEASLRLALMWNELLEKAKQSPTAVLGLIDIANSQNKLELVWDVLEPIIFQALNDTKFAEVDIGWMQISALLNKLENKKLKQKIIPHIVIAGELLTKRDWKSGLEFLQTQDFDDAESTPLIKQIIYRLTITCSPELLRFLGNFPSVKLLQIVNLSDEMTALIFFSHDNSSSDAVIEKLVEARMRLSDEYRLIFLKRVLPYIRNETSKFLPDLLSNITVTDLMEAARILWSTDENRSEKIGHYLCRSAVQIGGTKELRDVLLSLDDGHETIACIERILSFRASDIKWLVRNKKLGESKAILLNKLFNDASQNDLLSINLESTDLESAIEYLSIDIDRYQIALSRLFLISKSLSEKNFKIGTSIFSKIDEKHIKISIGSLILRESFKRYSEEKKFDFLEEAIKLLLDSQEFNSIINSTFINENKYFEFGQFLYALRNYAISFDLQIETQIYDLVKLVTDHERFYLTDLGAKALADLIKTVEKYEPDKFVDISLKVLAFSFKNIDLPVSSLVVETFPPIYNLLKSNDDRFAVGFFRFVDWDRCRVLRELLVHSFISSSWPPLDLAICALRTGDLEKIMKLVSKMDNDGKYLSSVFENSQYLSHADMKVIRSSINKIFSK